jgi:diadenosine tetraphosphate (Ap4A) HIT family hydrolase
MNLPDIFSSPDSLRDAFEEGLVRQLKEESLGTFILVLANAIFDEHIFLLLKDRLQDKFEILSQQYSNKLRQGKHSNDAPDDILVFLKLIAIGFNNLNTTEFRQTKDWELQFNQLRSLRPQRMSGAVISTLLQEFNDNAFHFNKPFLNKEVFWAGDIEGVAIKLLYNKFPFASLHGLLVPEAKKNLPQFLNSDMHNFISRLCREIGKSIPDIAIAYNGYGAGASINHLHFQTFTRQQPLPVLDKHWLHNGGKQVFPISCLVFEHSADSWQTIAELHQKNITYDLIYLPQRIICLPRKYQGSFDAPEWSENFAWYELCGGIITFNKEDFLKLDNDTIYKALALLKYP